MCTDRGVAVNRPALNVIGGERVPALSGRMRQDLAPATGSPLREVADSGQADVEAATAAAASAAAAWRGLGVEGRRTRLLAWAAAVRERAEEIALTDAHDSGTPLRTMRSGVGKGLDYLEHYAGLGLQLTGHTLPVTPDNLHYTVREPYGPVGVIIPFNHPGFFALSKTAPVLAAGNTVVLKPSEETPLSASLIAEAAEGILPAGVFNVVQGAAAVGQAMTADPRLARLHFTGGVRTGLAVQEGAARSGVVKHVTLELGGKNPLIVFPDVAPEVAARAAVLGMNFTRNQGQSCGSTSRLFVHDEVADAVTRRVCELVGQIRLGPPERESTEMGSLVSLAHQQRVLASIQRAADGGARVLQGGGPDEGAFAGGAYVQPTVLDAVRPEMEVARQEVFGPVLSILRWDDEQELLDAVNGTEYGLAAAVYTNDLSAALRIVRAVECGYVWVNTVETRWKGMPFGGYKNSGLGSEHSLEEMESYTRSKAVSMLPLQ